MNHWGPDPNHGGLTEHGGRREDCPVPACTDNTRETWPCATCGHKHYVRHGCADHTWTDHCPYEGLDCPDDVLAKKEIERVEQITQDGDNPRLDDILPPADGEADR